MGLIKTSSWEKPGKESGVSRALRGKARLLFGSVVCSNTGQEGPGSPSCSTAMNKADCPTLPPFSMQGVGEVSTWQLLLLRAVPPRGAWRSLHNSGSESFKDGLCIRSFCDLSESFSPGRQQLVGQLFMNESGAFPAEGGCCGQMPEQHMGTSQLFAGSELCQRCMLTDTDTRVIVILPSSETNGFSFWVSFSSNCYFSAISWGVLGGCLDG